jgi:hypothetical protein
MADWSLLRIALHRVDRSVRYSWAELDALVGGLPPSAARHRAWWSGDRSHVNAWRHSGFAVSDLVLGDSVTFVRVSARHRTGEGGNGRPANPSSPASSDLITGAPTSSSVGTRAADVHTAKEPDLDGSADRVEASSVGAEAASVLLVTCVKAKATHPAAARDLYVSTLFRKQRAYAEHRGLPWFILSAEHGLVAPEEWLAPYERYLPDTPRSFRDAWGNWVTERLELLIGDLRGRVIETHASDAYVQSLRAPMAAKGAALVEPLVGLAMGQRLAWYEWVPDADREPPPGSGGSSPHEATQQFVERLLDAKGALSPAAFLDRGRQGLDVCGLYSWWVDETGASELTAGLGTSIEPGLIYAGLAGATRWPSGRRSTNTLWSRIAGMHLGGRHEFSTFRRTLGAVLANGRGDATIDEAQLTHWMRRHLKVIAVPWTDADTLGRLEEDVLRRLDPPLNLKGMVETPTRQRLTELRRPHGRKKA